MMKKILLALCSLLCLTAYSQTGKIVGVVKDEYGETVVGAIVRVEGLEKGVSTDIDGKFVFNLDPGKYNLTVSFVSYQDKKVQGVEVSAGRITDLSIDIDPMDETALSGGDTSKRDSSAKTTVLTQVEIKARPKDNIFIDKEKIKSPGAVDGIGGPILRTQPMTTATDAMKKVTGATIQDNKFVVVRGMSDRYNAAYINGAPLPSSESDRRAISFDIFPANLLENIMIYKTASPNLPGEFAGGVVQINTKSTPEENSQSVTLGTGYNTMATFKDFQTYNGSKTDWLGMDNGTRKLPSGVPTTEDLRNSTMKERGEYARLFNSDWSLVKKQAAPNMNFQYTLGLSDTVLNNVAGMVFALNYYNNNSYSDTYRQEFEEQATEVIKTDTLHDQNYSNNVMASTLMNLSYKFGRQRRDGTRNMNQIIRFNNLYSVNSEDRVTLRSGARLFDQDEKQWERGTVRWFTQNNMYSGQLSGTHQLWNKIKFEWNGGYSDVMRDIPNMRRMIYQKTSRTEDDSTRQYAAVIDPNNSRSGGIMFFSNMHEKIYSGKYDITVPVQFKKSKNFSFDVSAGGLHQYRDRVFWARNIGYDKYRIGTSIRFNNNLLLLNEDEIFTSPYIGVMADSAAPYQGGFAVKETTRESDSYEAHASLNAWYGMMDIHLGKNLRLIGGVRYENYSQYLGTSENGKPIVTDTTVNDLLPSVNLVYSKITRRNGMERTLAVRAAYYRTVSRPEFRELAPFSFYDFITDFSLYGDAKLQRALIDNYDFRVEYFPSPGQLISGSVFYKKINTPTELASRPDAVRTLYYTNVPSATNIGAELEYRVNLSLFTPKRLDTVEWVARTSIFANGAYVHSEVDIADVIGATGKTRSLQGQSPYVINAGVAVFIPFVRILATGSYNVYGDRLYIVGNVSEPDYWEKSRNVVDVQLARDFSRKPLPAGMPVSKRDAWKQKQVLTIRANVRDLLAQKQILYQDLDGNGKYNEATDNTMVSTQWGRVFSLTLAFKF